MYREAMRCKTDECNAEVGERLISHNTGKVLVEAARRCSKCGAPGVNEAAYLWDIAPAHSDYIGPTIYQMALKALAQQV